MDALQLGLLLLTAATLLYWAAGWWSLKGLLRSPRPIVTGFTPFVSILKPVMGLDEGAYENFASFCRQDYPDYELLFGVPRMDDPVVSVIRQVQQYFPDCPIRIVRVPMTKTNFKCAILQELAVQARGEVLVANDSDIRVDPNYLRRVVSPLSDPAVGAVTCPYRSLPSKLLASRLEALYLNVVFLPSVILAMRWFGVPAGLGATIALRRTDLMRIGGYARIEPYLMDDYQLVQCITALGLRVELSDYVVNHMLDSPGYRQEWDRELRWASGIRASRPLGYLGVILTYTTPIALAMAAAWGWIAGLLLLIAALAIRGVLASSVLRRLEVPATWGDLAWVPGRECLSALVWCAGLFGRRIAWRGRDCWLRDGGRLECT